MIPLNQIVVFQQGMGFWNAFVWEALLSVVRRLQLQFDGDIQRAGVILAIISGLYFCWNDWITLPTLVAALSTWALRVRSSFPTFMVMAGFLRTF